MIFKSKKNIMRFLWWLKKPMYLWAKSLAYPKQTKQRLNLDPSKPVCYIFKRHSFFDLLVLDYHCIKEKLPRPIYKIDTFYEKNFGSHLCLTESGFLKENSKHKKPPHLQEILKSSQDHTKDIQLVPVSVFWGRNPGKVNQSFLKLLFFDDENGGWLHKIITFIFHGRHVFCNFGQAISSCDFMLKEKQMPLASKKLRRVLRIHFRRQRIAFLGPYIYDRNRTIKSLLREEPITRAIQQEITRKKISLEDAKKLAFKYADEIAANITYPTLRALEHALVWFFKKIYKDIQITNDEKIRQLAEQYEIVYLPCHRSHMDYLITGISIYNLGLTPPHTAAGVNLNFWPIGSLLRKSGAFFIRRTFANNRLYKSVFNEYLSFLLSEGFSVKFYIEGKRSRTGKLLKPKGGMLSMIVNQYKERPTRKTLLVPIYIGYDKIFEGDTYIKELGGKAKQTESLNMLFKARKIIKQTPSKAYLNFGEPVYLKSYLEQKEQDFLVKNKEHSSHDHIESKKLIVNELSFNIMRRINAAAVITPVSLFSLALSATPNKALNEKDLLALLHKWCDLLRTTPYSSYTVLPNKDLKKELHYAETISPIIRFTHPGGDVLYIEEKNKAALSYYRNNITHLFALPSLIAFFFEHNDCIPYDEVIDSVQTLYKFIHDEYFLPWNESEVEETIKAYLENLIGQNLLKKEHDTNIIKRVEMTLPEYSYTKILGRVIGARLEKYVIFTVLLYRYKAKNIQTSQNDFENECKLISTRLSILEGSRDAQLFDKQLFDEFIHLLKSRKYISIENSKIKIENTLEDLYKHTLMLLSTDVRNSVLETTITNNS